ncbi:MAG: IS607 family transposase [Candidatus Njordarchaeia archaeon]
MYSIGEFAKLINKSVKTLQRWDRESKLKSFRAPSGRRYYTEQQLLAYKGIIADNQSLIIAYCRVSTKNQKDDLQNQKEYINKFCLNRGLNIDEWYIDYGSGLNFKRKYFLRLMNEIEHGKVKTLVIAHKDRLVRFGFEYFEQFAINHGCEILVINDEKLSPEEEMIQDLISIIHVFSCRIYGLRKYKDAIDKEIKTKNQ